MHPPVTFAPARVAWGRTDRLRGLVSFQSEGRPIRLAAFLSRRFKLGASSFAPRTQYIHVHVHVAQLEVLAALAVYMSLPSWLAGRRVLHFIDNQGALSNLISCSSKDLDCAWMVHDFAIRAARLSCGVWFDYVRSKANLADLPSRGEFDLLLGMGSVEVLTSVPQRSSWTSIAGPRPSAQPSMWIDSEGVLRAAFPTTTEPSPATDCVRGEGEVRKRTGDYPPIRR